MSATFCITCLLMEHIAVGFSAVWSWCTLPSGQINTLETGEPSDGWKEEDVQDSCERFTSGKLQWLALAGLNWSVCQSGWSQVLFFCWSRCGGVQGDVSESIMFITCVCNAKGALNGSGKAESSKRAPCTGGWRKWSVLSSTAFPVTHWVPWPHLVLFIKYGIIGHKWETTVKNRPTKANLRRNK